jgi:hypothetical protein
MLQVRERGGKGLPGSHRHSPPCVGPIGPIDDDGDGSMWMMIGMAPCHGVDDDGNGSTLWPY